TIAPAWGLMARHFGVIPTITHLAQPMSAVAGATVFVPLELAPPAPWIAIRSDNLPSNTTPVPALDTHPAPQLVVVVRCPRNDRYPNHVVNAHPSGIRARGHVRNLLNHSALRQVQDGGGVGAVVRDHGKAEFLADREALGRRSHGNGTAKQLAKRRTGGVQVEFHNAVATGDDYKTEGRKRPVGNLISYG